MFAIQQDIENGSVIRKDLCIIGAGAAGITLAHEFLAASGTSVILLEAGGLVYDEPSRNMYDGKVTGNVLDKKTTRTYLQDSRLRFFGGTTNHWAGWCIPLDPWDFEKRDWVPHSGWPLTRDDLEPYYLRAAPMLDIKHFDYNFKDRIVSLGPELLPESDRIITRALHHSAPTRFGIKYRDALQNAPNIEVVTEACVVNIRCDETKQRINHVVVQTPEGKRYRVEAERFVLATGGIENARILLSATEDFPEGLGNQHDLVGRFFADHIEVMESNSLFLSHDLHPMTLYKRAMDKTLGHIVYGILNLREKVLREERLLQSSFYIHNMHGKRPYLNPLAESIYHTIPQVDQVPPGRDHASRPHYAGLLEVRAECAPNPDSRVLLQNERDAMGLRKVHLDWRHTGQDMDSIMRSLEIMGLELGHYSHGRLRLNITKDYAKAKKRGGWHHVGTTRMAEDPKQGVTDAQGQVHGIDNLYVAGSSLFPTMGFANPTYTIVALALRLADHLKGFSG